MVTKEMWQGRFIDAELTAKYFEICSKPFHGKGEKHHILPRSMWPEYEFCKWNLVNLSYQDHYKAHEMLAKMCVSEFDSKKMIKSWWIITNRFHGEYIDAEQYAELKSMARKAISEQMKGNKHGVGNLGNIGRKLSEETKAKISDAVSGEKHPFYGRTHSDEVIEIYRKLHTGNKYRLGVKASDETKRKQSELKKGKQPWLGKQHTEESRLKMSRSSCKFVYIKDDCGVLKEYTTEDLILCSMNVRCVRNAIRSNTRYLGCYWSRRPK